MKFCSHCGTSKFGLIRHRHQLHQFCSKVCKESYLARIEREQARLASWYRWLYGSQQVTGQTT